MLWTELSILGPALVSVPLSCCPNLFVRVARFPRCCIFLLWSPSFVCLSQICSHVELHAWARYTAYAEYEKAFVKSKAEIDEVGKEVSRNEDVMGAKMDDNKSLGLRMGM